MCWLFIFLKKTTTGSALTVGNLKTSVLVVGGSFSPDLHTAEQPSEGAFCKL